MRSSVHLGLNPGGHTGRLGLLGMVSQGFTLHPTNEDLFVGAPVWAIVLPSLPGGGCNWDVEFVWRWAAFERREGIESCAVTSLPTGEHWRVEFTRKPMWFGRHCAMDEGGAFAVTEPGVEILRIGPYAMRGHNELERNGVGSPGRVAKA